MDYKRETCHLGVFTDKDSVKQVLSCGEYDDAMHRKQRKNSIQCGQSEETGKEEVERAESGIRFS